MTDTVAIRDELNGCSSSSVEQHCSSCGRISEPPAGRSRRRNSIEIRPLHISAITDISALLRAAIPQTVDLHRLLDESGHAMALQVCRYALDLLALALTVEFVEVTPIGPTRSRRCSGDP